MKVFISVFTLSQLIKFAILVLKALANQLHECKSYKIKFGKLSMFEIAN